MADLGSLLGAAGVGGVIGKAIVQLELSTAKYQAELQGAEAKTRGFGAAAGTAFAAVGVAAVAGLALSVKAAVEANDAHIKLQNTFANNAKLSDSSVEAFEAQADSLRDLTGVDDEAIIRGQALLGQFDLTGNKVMELTPLIVDLSEKMGIDLETAAKAVGKATEGNTGSLARYIGVIEKGSTPTETYANILEKLGRVQGFAAESADAEPWKVISAQFEEVAEKIGTALLPAVQGLSESLAGLLPLLTKVAEGMQFLPIAQMGEDFSNGGSNVEQFANALIDTVPILGHYVQLGGEAVAVTEDHLGVVEALSAFYRSKYTAAVGEAGEATKNFAHMTIKEFHDWATETQKALRDTTFALEGIGDASQTSGKDFSKAQHEMLHDARVLADAMEEISGEKWVNDKYLQFLTDQGPGAIAGFADANEKQQKRLQEDWLKASKGFDDSLGTSFKNLDNALDNLDNKTTSHTVKIKYEYVNFDPSKPGMGGMGAQP